MENFDIGRELEQLDIESLIDEGAEYEEIITAISQIELQGEKERFIEYLKKKRGGTKAAIRKDIESYLKNAPFTKDHPKREEKKLSEDEQAEALALLQSPDLMERFLNAVNDLGCVGEEENKVFLYGLCTSRMLENPIGAIVKGKSSAGKNFIVSSVLQFFPEEDVVLCTTITPKALYHRKDSLKNKILAIHERIGAEDSDYSIRVLLSEQKLIISTPVKNPDTGRFETEDIEMEGPVAYIETTTQVHVHDENETRLFAIHPDESLEQTERIHSAQKRLYKTTNLDRQEILRPWKNAQRLLEPRHILIPYIDLVCFPAKPLRVRRDHLRFLSLVEVFALLFQHQRRIMVENDKEYVIADIRDYTLAYGLIGKILESVLKGLSPQIKELIDAAEKMGSKEFTNKELMKHVKWNRQTLTKYIKAAVDSGHFEIKEQGGHGKAYRYELIKAEEGLLKLRTPEEMAHEMIKMSMNVQRHNGHSKLLEMQDKSGNVQN